MSDLSAQVQRLVDRAVADLQETPFAADLRDVQKRVREPLRVAIAGKVKAGKSTLLNALVGEAIAPTDFSECTTIVTWYRDGSTYRVMMHPHDGPAQPLPFHRSNGALEISIGQLKATDVARIEVDWPSPTLRTMTLIDTPGIDSINTELSNRTHSFLTSEEHSAPTDAVLYLMRHLHQSDVRFLESFHDQIVARPSAINSIGILSRSDEIGVGRLDAMISASRIAKRYATDPKVRRLCQTVLPLAGLLASTATTLRQDEYRMLALLSSQPASSLDDALLSTDRFLAYDTDLYLAEAERAELLDRFGIFGIRVACDLIRTHGAASSQELATKLCALSGVNEVKQTLHTHFATRADVLRARSALLALDPLFTAAGPRLASHLTRDLERITSNVHEFSEIQLLSALRSSLVRLPAADVAQAERLLGASGTLAHQRLGVDAETTLSVMHAHALAMHHYWQVLSENPLMSLDATDAARTLTRTCEGLVAAIGASR